MNLKELDFVLKAGEGQFIEFKEKFSGLEKEIVAFANASGGKIFIGISDNSKVKGIEITNKLKSKIQDIANNCDPDINIKLEEFENVLIIHVPEGKNKPYSCKEGFYLRMGPNSQKMKRDEIIDLITSVNTRTFDSLFNKRFDFKKDFDNDKFKNYLDRAELSRVISKESILQELGVMDEKLNNAGILFFAKKPQKFYQQSVYTVVVFRDKEGADVIERKEIEGSLVEIVDQVMKFIEFYVKVAYKFTGKPERKNIYQYPKEAIREAIINSVMHKDYFETGHNNILKIFPGRLQIENIWKKPKNFELGKTVFRRNPIIANLFSKIHFGEKLGSGFARIKEYCKKEKAPLPEIKFTDTHFYIVFKQNPEYLGLAKNKKGEFVDINERQKNAVNYLKKNNMIVIRDYIQINHVSDKTARRDLRDLVEKGLLIKEGTTTNASFKLRPTSANFGQEVRGK